MSFDTWPHTATSNELNRSVNAKNLCYICWVKHTRTRIHIHSFTICSPFLDSPLLLAAVEIACTAHKHTLARLNSNVFGKFIDIVFVVRMNEPSSALKVCVSLYMYEFQIAHNGIQVS